MSKKAAKSEKPAENVEKPEDIEETTEEIEETEDTDEGEPINLMESAPPPKKKPKQVQAFNPIDFSEVTSELKKINNSVEKLLKGEPPPNPEPKPKEMNLIDALGDW